MNFIKRKIALLLIVAIAFNSGSFSYAKNNMFELFGSEISNDSETYFATNNEINIDDENEENDGVIDDFDIEDDIEENAEQEYEEESEDEKVASESELEESENDAANESEIEESEDNAACESDIEESEKNIASESEINQNENIENSTPSDANTDENFYTDIATTSEANQDDNIEDIDIAPISEIDNEELISTISEIEEETNDIPFASTSETTNINEASNSEITEAETQNFIDMQLFGAGTPSDIDLQFFGADSVLGVDYGYWYVTDEAGNLGPRSSTFCVLHLTTDDSYGTVTNQSGQFSFSRSSRENFGTVITYMKKVVFESDFAPKKTTKLLARNAHANNNIVDIVGMKEYLNTADVTDMDSMFHYCVLLPSIDLSGFNTENVTNMSSLFQGLFAITSIDVSNFNTEKVTNMSSMFYACLELKTLDISNFKNGTGGNINIDSMFMCSNKLETIYTSEDFNNLIGNNVFKECSDKLVGGNGTKWDGVNLDYTYAKIDDVNNPGYFTNKNISHKLNKKVMYNGSENDTVGSCVIKRAGINPTEYEVNRAVNGQVENIITTVNEYYEVDTVKIHATKNDGSHVETLGTLVSESSTIPNISTYSCIVPTDIMVGSDIDVVLTIKAKDYDITKNDQIHGDFTVQDTATYSEIVHIINVVSDIGYEVDEIKVKDIDNNVINVSTISESEYTFTMPDKEVNVEITFKIANYSITKNAPIYGIFEVQDTATYSEIVHIEGVAVDTGCYLDTITVKDINNNVINVSTISESEYTFTMPDKEVNVEIIFTPYMYGITKTPPIHGDFTVQNTATYSEIVHIEGVAADTGCYLDTITVKDIDNNVINVSTISESEYTFIMPDKEVNVEIIFTPYMYGITKTPPIHGAYEVQDTATYSEIVHIINVVSDIGYEVDEIKVKDINNNEIDIATISESEYTFIMPDKGVNVEITFKIANYNITKNTPIYGAYEVQDIATYSEIVHIEGVAVDTGCYLDTIIVKDIDNNVINVSTISESEYTFTMPDKEVNVEIIFTPYVYTVTKTPPIHGAYEVQDTATYSEIVHVTNVVPDIGYEVDEIKVKDINNNVINVSTISESEYTFTMPDKEVNVEIIFTPYVYTITKTPPIHGDFTVQNTATYSEIVHIEGVAADTGCYLDTITVKDIDNNVINVSTISESEYTFTMPDKEVNVEIIFTPYVYTITKTPPIHGDFTVQGTATYSEIVHITNVVSDTGCYLDILKVKDIDNNVINVSTISESEYTFIMPEKDVTVEIVYGIYNYQITKEDVENGTFKITTTSNAEATTSHYGQEVTITFSPDNGYILDTVEVYKTEDITIVVPTTQINNNKYVFTMPLYDVTVKITYKILNTDENYQITKESCENGTFKITTTSEAEATTAHYNQEVKITLSPNSGYILDTVEVHKIGDITTDVSTTQVNDDTYTFIMPSYDVTVKITYKILNTDENYQIIKENTVNGTFKITTTSDAEATTAHYGQEVKITLVPENEYKLDTIKVRKTGSNAMFVSTTKANDNTYIFTMPSYDVTIKVKFTHQSSPVPPTPHGGDSGGGNASGGGSKNSEDLIDTTGSLFGPGMIDNINQIDNSLIITKGNWEYVPRTDNWKYFTIDTYGNKKYQKNQWALIKNDNEEINWYAFDDKGNMVTGWVKYYSEYYFMYQKGEEKGKLARENIIFDKRKYKLDNTNGKLLDNDIPKDFTVIGAVNHKSGIDGDWIIDKSTGKNKFIKSNVKYKNQTTKELLSEDSPVGWYMVDGYYYHFDEKGCAETGLIISDGKYYYLEPDGKMLEGGEKMINGARFIFDKATGACRTIE